MQNAESSQVEDALAVTARLHQTTRFVKLHHEIAEMENISPPALLAYRGAEVFATIVDIRAQMKGGEPVSSQGVEDLLKAYVSPFLPSFLLTFFLIWLLLWS